MVGVAAVASVQVMRVNYVGMLAPRDDVCKVCFSKYV